MTATPPEASNEYSRARWAFLRPQSGTARRAGTPPPAARTALAALALAGAVLLLVAEFLPLYSLHLITSDRAISSVSTGSHNSYALIPLALLAAVLAVGAVRSGSPAAAAALAAVGLVALLIALLGDLPDTNAHGIAHGDVLAATTARAGLYVETLGAVVLLLAGGAALVAAGPLPPRGRRRPQGPARPAKSRSAS